MVECLIGMKVNLNKVDSFGNSPLNVSFTHLEKKKIQRSGVQFPAGGFEVALFVTGLSRLSFKMYFKNPKRKQKKCLINVFICDKDTLAVLDKFLAGFYLANFQNYFANKLIKWFVFEARSKHSQHVFYRS